ncbi:Aste57867_24477 [Aphanomyces stellatus]|uniref:Aste57867_24477 protein n=1 Tax=Aphanomyces stellatus TaxID=120398 RepID=A0A485LRK5_9STRA|nr:hypothetical protein As57867_024400 [Aphanomyces stellatus]VFU01116.1 Aste57867_24477 [Aphanomyces stellatus]
MFIPASHSRDAVASTMDVGGLDLEELNLPILDDLLVDDGMICEEIFLPLAATNAMCRPPTATGGHVVDSGSIDSTSLDGDDNAGQSTLSRPPKRVRASMKHELDYLRIKHASLVHQLRALEVGDVQKPRHAWEERAKDQMQAAQRALHENARLKEALDDQLKMVEALRRVFLKKPRLSVFPTPGSDWKIGKLGSSCRQEAVAELLAHQHTMMETEWIRNDMYTHAASTAKVKQAFVRSCCHEQVLLVQFIQCSTWPVPVAQLAPLLWDIATMKTKVDFPTKSVMERIGSFGDDIMYTRSRTATPGNPAVDGRYVTKRATDDRHQLIIWRSIVEDTLWPIQGTDLTDIQSGWIRMTPTGVDGQHTRLSILSSHTPPLAPTDSVQAGAITEFLIGILSTNSIALDMALTHALGLSCA